MSDSIKPDSNNYRKHSDKNKKLINKSLSELGAGRSILIDSENEIIAGNGVFEQAQKLGIPIKVIESDGRALIAIKRTDLTPEDEKRIKLAISDNKTSDTSSFDIELLNEEFDLEFLNDLGFETLELGIDVDLLEEPEDLTAELKDNPPTIKITFEEEKYMNEFEKHLKSLSEEYGKIKYSVSQGEL